jgi:molybdopterin-containing oxidoreductase family membrane subunit
MLERVFTGSDKYYKLLMSLLAVVAVGFGCYLYQLTHGLTVTGMSRDVSWGLYIAQFTFLVGVAASAVMVVLPYYLHHYKTFGRITILGEFLAVSAVTMCLLFIIVDLGQPQRALNVLLHPTPNSVLFWDMIVLNGYLFINIIVGWNVLAAERKGVMVQSWVKPLIYLSIPWAVSIHTVTAFLYAGLPGRHSWLTAILAARFLASAFAAGPSLLILLCLFLRKHTKFDAGKEAIQKLATIVTYAMLISIFFVLLEVFTAFYSNIPGHMHGLKYIFFGLEGHARLTPWMWAATVMAFGAAFILLNPGMRENEMTLKIACTCVFLSLWIEKGIIFVISGFVPTPTEHVVEYYPSIPELCIVVGVWALGFFILSLLYKIAISIKEELAA